MCFLPPLLVTKPELPVVYSWPKYKSSLDKKFIHSMHFNISFIFHFQTFSDLIGWIRIGEKVGIEK